MQQSQSNTSWREHPWIAALIGGGATAVFFMSVVSPILMKTEQNSIDDLRHQVAELKALADADLKDRETLKKQTAEISTQINEIARLRAGAPFEGGNPYPRGFRSVHLGEPISNVVAAYGVHAKVKDDWVEVNDGNPLIEEAVFYKSENKKSAVVERILFETVTTSNEQIGGSSIRVPRDFSDAIEKELTETFGMPNQVIKRDGEIWTKCWYDKSGVDLEWSPTKFILQLASKEHFSLCLK